jgi:hypothetical protein
LRLNLSGAGGLRDKIMRYFNILARARKVKPDCGFLCADGAGRRIFCVDAFGSAKMAESP